LSTSKTLTSFSVKGGGGSQQLPLIFQVDDAPFLAQVLVLPTLEKVNLSTMCWLTVDAAMMVFHALARSQFTTLTLHDLIMPDDAQEAWSVYLGISKIIHLELASNRSAADGVLRDVVLREFRFTKTIQTFVLGSWMECSRSEDLVRMLEDSDGWRLRELTLSLSNWTDAFDKAISKYVRTNTYLRKLSFAVSEDFDMRATASQRFIHAVASGRARRLEEVVFMRDEKEDELTSSWCKDLLPILYLNRQRNVLRPKLKAATLARTGNAFRLGLSEALEALELEGLFAFLRSDELQLMSRLQRHGRQHTADVTQCRSRKRPATQSGS
jgi:hypothetical protein